MSNPSTFTFLGAAANAPAPAAGTTATGGFPFGGGAAPAPAGSAPAPTGFGASAPAPGAPLFGASSTPAPAPTATFGGFGSSPAPAPSGGFGTATTTTTTNAFGAPAPAAGTTAFSFGPAPAPAPATTTPFGGYGSTPAGAPAASPFGFSAPQQQQQQQQQESTIEGSMQYSSLNPEMKGAIDRIHEAIMRHKRTMLNLQTTGPHQLQKTASSTGDSQTTPLQERVHKMRTQLQRLQQDFRQLEQSVSAQNKASEKAMVDTIMYAQWPVEATAVRRNVRLTSFSSSSSNNITAGEEKKDQDGTDQNSKSSSSNLQLQVRDALNQALSSVDNIQRIPSPYYWEKLHELESRALEMKQQVDTIHQQLQQSWTLQQHQENQNTTTAIAEIIETQHLALARLEAQFQQLSTHQMQLLRYRYNAYERGENVLEKAAMQEMDHERRIHEQMELFFLQAAPEKSSSGAAPTPGAAAAPGATFGGGFGSGAAPAPAAFSFGASAPAPGTGLFGGGAAAPAQSATSLFPPAPAANPFASFGATTTVSSNKKSSKGSGRKKN